MLQAIKTKNIQNNPKAAQLQAQFNQQLTVFQEAEQAYKTAESNNGEPMTAGAFAQVPMSIEELEAKMNEEQLKLERLMTAFNTETDKKVDTTPTKEDKNKIQPKQAFTSLA